ncbi:TRAP transporter substrate-binding protein DctP [Calidifontimicrobium sp. SYSU G02091]|uniref:TRAP transporter substrate-binding protein DctP n=1 Tax=Calidifontimicrobium sp. SYSU G02091 TaxID=2926421 RepID=UPI001F53DCBE|nr:TRAP transporter substrate-binding protein DctP [Calidifontimicrobium sp. SYSU G02091]MCI1193070.1 TRAP transporter substrate-binding protein DctP [Calidifontimicrobium sp. SYSU G02091]
MKRRHLIGTGVAGLGMLATVGAQAQTGPTYNWKMATGWAGGPLMDIGAKAFAERMELLSGGRFKIQTFPGGALGNALKVPETVKNGLAECGHTWIGYDWGKDPTTVLFGGYAGSFDAERMLHWLYEAGGAEMQREFREEVDGVVSFPLFMRTAEVFLHSRRPVRTLADLKGLKLRTAGAWLEMAKDLGAAPVTTAGGDVFPMLERGAIDATEWGTLWENISPGFFKVAKFLSYPGVHQPCAPFELVINKGVWDKMPANDRRLVEVVAKLVTFESWARIGVEDAKAFDFYRKNGVTMIELDDEVQFATRKLGLEWAAKTAQEGKFKWFARVHKSQQDFDLAWRDADSWRKVKVQRA